MIIICEECGKKYRIDREIIDVDGAKFKCKSCNHLITIEKEEDVFEPEPEFEPEPDMTEDEEVDFGAEETFETETDEMDDLDDYMPDTSADSEMEEEPREQMRTTDQSVASAMGQKKGGFGLRSKMILLFLLIPSVLLVLAGVLYYNQLTDLSTLLTSESANVVTRISEDVIANKARSVANQCQLYLDGHPELTREAFDGNAEFKRIALSKVGMTGYTALFERPSGSGDMWPTWVHVNSKLIGTNMKDLEKKFPDFWKIFLGSKGGKESQGYYKWKDNDGKTRDKFMVCTPISGTNLVIAATTYLDEFTRPVRRMEVRADKITQQTRNIVLGILGGTLILIGLIVSLYSHKLSGRIQSLTDHAERISVGELDAELEIKSKDEIGDLGEAITRMQDSIRLSIERLRRRR